MLHVVQVVIWGVAETPQLFLDEAKAGAAYVECAKKHWEQRYSAYCEHHGLSSDSFAVAQTFVGTIDVSEKSRINYWTFDVEEAGLGGMTSLPGGAGMKELRHAAEEIVAVKAGMERLMDDLSHLVDRFARMDVSPVEAPVAGGPEMVEAFPDAVRQEEAEPDPAARATPEWQAFVGTIKRLGSGSRNEFLLLHRDDWRKEVYNNRTSLEYWDWVADRIGKYKERAKNAGYSIFVDPDSPGCYRFTDPGGIANDDCFDSEWEGWCAAGLDFEAKCRDAAG